MSLFKGLIVSDCSLCSIYELDFSSKHCITKGTSLTDSQCVCVFLWSSDCIPLQIESSRLTKTSYDLELRHKMQPWQPVSARSADISGYKIRRLDALSLVQFHRQFRDIKWCLSLGELPTHLRAHKLQLYAAVPWFGSWERMHDFCWHVMVNGGGVMLYMVGR